MTIGINWKPVWQPVWKQVWKQTAPIPPSPTPPQMDGGGAGRLRLPPRWKQIEERNQEDIEIVRVLVEFLSRIS